MNFNAIEKQNVKDLDNQIKEELKIIKDNNFIDLLDQDITLQDSDKITLLTAFIRYFATLKKLDQIFLNKSIFNRVDSIDFHKSQLELHKKAHKKAVDIKYFLITN
tara:strand:- start:1781 stop:2098 length:318 start_codon:yes stop_codon:yes gene_type:complete